MAAALVAWWPAFDLGAYGVLFFNQFLSRWAASTAIFLVSLTAGGRARVSWARRLALLIPSLWLLLAAVVGTVAIAAFGLGQFNNRFLTCNDFIISGNDTPPGCAQGHGHLGNR